MRIAASVWVLQSLRARGSAWLGHLCLVGAVALASCSNASGTPEARNGTPSASAMTSQGAGPLLVGAGAGQSGSGAPSATAQTTAVAPNTGAGRASVNPMGQTPPPPAAGCEPDALDQQGCPCNKVGAVRSCYSADPVTRNVGECKDGVQTCTGEATAADAEFGQQFWGPCMEQVVPSECTEQLDARCVGKVGCADEQCADKLGCPKDAGVPDAGNRHCITVRGFGIGTGFFADGGMWCER